MTRADVPCRGCTACCRFDVALEPTDDPTQYRWHLAPLRIGDSLVQLKILDKKPDGLCVYAGQHGCTIHGSAPAVCRRFDCRAEYARRSRPERRDLVRHSSVWPAVLRAALTRIEEP